MSTQSILQSVIAASEGGFAATAIKATAAVIAALLLIRLARRASASLRHLLAATTFGVLLLLPFASALVPPRVVPVWDNSPGCPPPKAAWRGGPTRQRRLP